MYMKHIFLQTCQLIVLLSLTRTYVLFAANLDDFRSIAKKFIPNKLADQLTDMAAQNSMKYRQQQKKNKQVYKVKESDEYSNEAIKKEEVTESVAIREFKTSPKKRFAIKDQVKNMDFDELVDRVREQLEDKLKAQLKKETHKKEDSDSSNDDYEENNSVATVHIDDNNYRHKYNITKKKIQTKVTTEDPQMYYDNVAEKEPSVAENDGTMFKEADLNKKKDSYEDYVTPDKENIFDSDSETKTTKSQRTLHEKEPRYNEQTLKAVAAVKHNPAVSVDDDQDYAEHRSEEIKAKTETLFDEPERKGNVPKKLKGTMIPTREYYKMSSPNYYAKIPAVAEKYDFNEPLPERDREPENLKYFVNPPAFINKKVKLTSA